MANQIVLTGRLVKDAELAYLPGAGIPKATFTVATDRNYQKDKNNKKTDFIPAEMIGIEGELNIDQYEKDGAKKSFTKVKVDRLEFLGGGKQEDHDPTGKFKEVLDDDELPF